MAKRTLLMASVALGLVVACNRNEAPPSSAGERAEPKTTAQVGGALEHAGNPDGGLVPASRTAQGHAGTAAPKQAKNSPPPRTPDVVYVPTPQPVVDKMLELAAVKSSDIVYDLGCGDGRIVVTAAKRYGVRAYGFDIDPARVAEAKENVARNGVGDLVTIEQKDIFTLDLSPASVVTLYLLPDLNVKLIPQLEKLEPGSRIVSHDFDMRGVKPARHLEVRPDGTSRSHSVYLFNVPLERDSTASRESRP